MYVTVQEVRNRGKLLTTGAISDSDVMQRIIDAESYINMCLSRLYLTPISPITNPDGTISVTHATKNIIGTGTLFVEKKVILPSSHIYIIDSNEVAVIDTVTDDTTAAVTVNFASDATNSPFYIIPEEIATATSYYAVKLIYEWKFSEQAFNQKTDAVSTQYSTFAEQILALIQKGGYYNASLKPQIAAQTSGRAISVYGGIAHDNNAAIMADYSSWWPL